MTYSREKGAAHCVDVRLPRRSLQVQAGGVVSALMPLPVQPAMPLHR